MAPGMSARLSAAAASSSAGATSMMESIHGRLVAGLVQRDGPIQKLAPPAAVPFPILIRAGPLDRSQPAIEEDQLVGNLRPLLPAERRSFGAHRIVSNHPLVPPAGRPTALIASSVMPKRCKVLHTKLRAASMSFTPGCTRGPLRL
jgi:hypothetical protein